ncbi:MAG TPA: SDR family oxidoreductase [Acidimicrobiales bacterium]|nr:SDR family oxidoreductase [Acidimicrobiales bacterium]
MPFTIDLEGRLALVTGAGQGVGRAIALALASAGGAVAVNDFVPDRAESVAEEIRAAGGEAVPAPFDVSDFDAVMSAVERVGNVDILVNNAGNAGPEGFNFGPFAQTRPSDWARYFGVNLFGVMHCTRAALPGMIDRQDGRVVTIISDAARWGEPYMGAYAAAKAGAAGFSRSVAREVGRHGITANCVALGSIDPSEGPAEAEATPEEADRLHKQLRGYIIRRRGRPEDVSGLVTFLVSPLASWITGQTYPVNGGYTVNQ